MTNDRQIDKERKGHRERFVERKTGIDSEKEKLGNERDQKEYKQALREKGIIKKEPWSSGYGKRLSFQRSWIRIPAPYTGWTFFHIYLLEKL